MTITSSPLTIPDSARANAPSTSSHASGAPSEPCRGAERSASSVDRMCPIGRSRWVSWSVIPASTAAALPRPFRRRLAERAIDLRKDLVVELEQPRLVIDDVAVVNGQCAEKWNRVLAQRWEQVHRLQNATGEF